MTRKLISSGSPFEARIGYSRAVADGDWVFVSGTTGFDYATMTIAESAPEQAEQCFRNIAAALAEAGGTLHDVVRVRYMLPAAADVCPGRRRRKKGGVTFPPSGAPPRRRCLRQIASADGPPMTYCVAM